MNDQAATISHAKDTLIDRAISAVLAALRARGVVIPAPQREVRPIGQPA